METGFDLSPVINLLIALSPADKPPSPQTHLQRVTQHHNPPSLGDFTHLWNFLGHEPQTRSATPTSVLGLPPPPPSPLPLSSKLSVPGPEPPPSGTSSLSSTPLSEPPSPGGLSWTAKTQQNTTQKERKKVMFQTKPFSITPKNNQQRQSPQKLQEIREIKITIDGEETIATWQEHPVIQSNVPLATRKVNLVKKLIQVFPNDAATLTRQLSPPTLLGIHVFIDFSNVCSM